MRARIALFQNHPECSTQCCSGMIRALSTAHDVTLFPKDVLNAEFLRDFDVVAFPGGIGDADTYHRFFRRRVENAVADFVENGGHYLGICMGAYWAGSHYFDILDGVDAVQYICRPGADVRRSYATVANVRWQDEDTNMFFYDGCALIGDETKFRTVARYANGDPMAIIQNRIGIIGCHPESEEDWYTRPYQYVNQHWHQGRHHAMLSGFVDQLVGNTPI